MARLLGSVRVQRLPKYSVGVVCQGVAVEDVQSVTTPLLMLSQERKLRQNVGNLIHSKVHECRHVTNHYCIQYFQSRARVEVIVNVSPIYRFEAVVLHFKAKYAEQRHSSQKT